MAITRRHVLAATSAMGAAATLGVGTTAYRWWDQPPKEGLTALSETEWSFVQSLGEAWMPPGGEPALSGAEARVGDFVDDVVARMEPLQGKLLKVLMNLLDESTLPTRMARFQSLGLETRTEVLRSWLDGPLYLQRQAVGAVVALVGFGYTSHPDVAGLIRQQFRCGFGP